MMNGEDDYHGHTYSYFRKNICIMIRHNSIQKDGMKHHHPCMIIASIINLETNVVKEKNELCGQGSSLHYQGLSLFYTRLDPSRLEGTKSRETTSRGHLFKSPQMRLDPLNPKSIILQPNPKILIPICSRFHP